MLLLTVNRNKRERTTLLLTLNRSFAGADVTAGV